MALAAFRGIIGIGLIYDEVHSIEEERYITIGLAGEILFVVYTERRPRIRLISARLATEKERKVYYGNI